MSPTTLADALVTVAGGADRLHAATLRAVGSALTRLDLFAGMFTLAERRLLVRIAQGCDLAALRTHEPRPTAATPPPRPPRQPRR